MYLKAEIDMGHQCYDQDSQFWGLTIEFVDDQGHRLFEIVPDRSPLGRSFSNKELGSCSLIDASGEKILVIEQRQSRAKQVKVKSPTGDRLFDVERQMTGGLQGHFAGVCLFSNKIQRYHLQRYASSPYQDPHYTFIDSDSPMPLGSARILPANQITSNALIIGVNYQVDIFRGGDASMCALFAYLIHWAELRNLASQFEKAAKIGLLQQTPDHLINGEHLAVKIDVEGPTGLHGFKGALSRGWKGYARLGLDMLGGPYSVAYAGSSYPSSSRNSYRKLA